MGRDPPVIPGPSWSPGQIDAAETFAESDVTVSHDSTGIESGSVKLDYARKDDLPHSDTHASAGVYVTPTNGHAVDQFGAQIHPDNEDAIDRVELQSSDGGTTHDSVTGVSPGDTVAFSYSLTGGTEYRIVAYASASSFQAAFEDENSEDTSLNVSINGGWNSNFGDSSSLWVFDAVGAVSGSTVVSWPLPADLAGWDIIPYQIVEDGGTVEVYAEDSTGSELAGPLPDPGDISTISRSKNVQTRVDLSRTSLSNDPRTDAVYRRFKV